MPLLHVLNYLMLHLELLLLCLSLLYSVCFKRRNGTYASKEKALTKTGGDTQVKRLISIQHHVMWNLSPAARWVQCLPAPGLQNTRIQRWHTICHCFATQETEKLLAYLNFSWRLFNWATLLYRISALCYFSPARKLCYGTCRSTSHSLKK